MTDHEDAPMSDAQRVGQNLDSAISTVRTDRLKVAKQSLTTSRRRARQARGRDDRPVRAETQVLVNGDPATATDLAAAAKRQPSTAPDADAPAAAPRLEPSSAQRRQPGQQPGA